MSDGSDWLARELDSMEHGETRMFHRGNDTVTVTKKRPEWASDDEAIRRLAGVSYWIRTQVGWFAALGYGLADHAPLAADRLEAQTKWWNMEADDIDKFVAGRKAKAAK